MTNLVACLGLCLGLAFVACADSPAVPASSEATVCCTDYVCEATGFETTGCVKSHPTPSQAFAACNAACDERCVLLATYCD